MTEAAVAAIRDRILDLTLSPGSRIDEKMLHDRCGISRTPAREALNRLATEGLLDIKSNRGAFVRSMEIEDTAQFMQAYFVVERSAGYFCRFENPSFLDDMHEIQRKHSAAVREKQFLDIAKYNLDFHTRIARATENSYLIDFSTHIHNMSRRLVYFIYHRESVTSTRLQRQQVRILAEHDAIIECIRHADRDGLIAMLTSHAERFKRRLAGVIRNQKGANFPLG